jgi:hypothetical protein
MPRLRQQPFISRWEGGSYKLYPQCPPFALHVGLPLAEMGHQNYPINHQEIAMTGRGTLVFRRSLSNSLEDTDITEGKWGTRYH